MESRDPIREGVRILADWISECPREGMVFLGGAGVSTESGIPDFRSASGIYSKSGGRFSPEEMVSRSFFEKHPSEFYGFYLENMVFDDAEPNGAHRALAELEHAGKLSCVITQNVDGLHQAAGSEEVLELHGSIQRNSCMRCGRSYGLDDVKRLSRADDEGIPRCEDCGSIIKPDVVLFEEPLDSGVIEAAVDAVSSAWMLVVAGTSLAVHPAAGLLRYYRGDHLAIINLSSTPYDAAADLRIEGRIGEVLSEAVALAG